MISAVADTSGLATLVALTTTRVGEVTTGAVNRPMLETAPALAFQTTPVLLVDVNAAVNCCLLPEERVSLTGDKTILIPDVFDACPGDMLAQPVKK